MKAGDRIKVPVTIEGAGSFRSAVVGFRFDDKTLAIRSVIFGDVFGTLVNTAATPFLNQNGKLYVSLTAADGKEVNASGTIAFIEVELLTNGRAEIALDRDVLSFLTGEGKNFAIKLD